MLNWHNITEKIRIILAVLRKEVIAFWAYSTQLKSHSDQNVHFQKPYLKVFFHRWFYTLGRLQL